MKYAELRSKSVEELQGLLHEHRDRLEKARFQVAGGTSKDVRALRELKLAIARIMTAISAAKGVPAAAKPKTPKTPPAGA